MSAEAKADEKPPPPKPSRLSLEGIVQNATEVIDKALDPKQGGGIPPKAFEGCKGIIIFSCMQYGFILAGTAGNGVVLARKEDGTWSPPAALGFAGFEGGLVIGGKLTESIVILRDDSLLKKIDNNTDVKLGTEMGLTAGPVGREAQVSLSEGENASFAYSFSKGVFAGGGFRGTIVKPQPKENAFFYGKPDVTVEEILFKEGSVTVPENSSLPEFYKKLAMLESGKTTE